LQNVTGSNCYRCQDAGIDGNEIADQLARQDSSYPLTILEFVVGISAKAARVWVRRKHREYWQSICGQRQARDFLKGLTAERAEVLLRNQLRIVTGLLTGHCHLKEHLVHLGLTKSFQCDT
jgi:hypothetical protein